MSETILQNSWAELYREALMESDPTKLPARIEEAYKAIHRRALELSYASSGDTRERRDLDVTLHFLDLLRTVTSSPAHDVRNNIHDEPYPYERDVILFHDGFKKANPVQEKHYVAHE
jgi:hypothetical protein